MKRRQFITLLGCATVSSHKVWAQPTDSRVADLVRAGKIRVALFLPLYAKDPVTGALIEKLLIDHCEKEGIEIRKPKRGKRQ